MTLIQWDEFMSVGVREMDEQHKQLISLINQAYEAIQKHDSRDMARLLDKMREYADIHFSDEEKLMKEHGYPDLEHHKMVHAKFACDVEEFRKKQHEKTNFSQLFVYLSRWLTTHIMEEDKKYTAYMPTEETKQNQ